MFKRKKQVVDYLGCPIVCAGEVLPFVMAYRVLTPTGVLLGIRYSFKSARRLVLDFYDCGFIC